jgi:hypothetical protein
MAMSRHCPRNNATYAHSTFCGVVWDSQYSLVAMCCTVLSNLIPTKTLRVVTQLFWERLVSSLMISFHVCGTMFVVFMFCFILLVIAWSSCNHLSITFNQHFLTISSVCVVLHITLSHLKVQIKSADSDISIFRRCVAPLFVMFAFWLSLLLISCLFRREMVLQPRIRLILGSSQGPCFSGHVSSARAQIIFFVGLLQCTMMCSIDSVSSQHSGEGEE